MQANDCYSNDSNDNDTSSDLQKQQKQQCPICLYDLLSNIKSNCGATVGALIPCGHCMHSKCYRQWKNADYSRRRVVAHQQHRNSDASAECICPICNAPATTFVALFLDTQLPPVKAAEEEDEDDGEEEDDNSPNNIGQTAIEAEFDAAFDDHNDSPIVVLAETNATTASATRTATTVATVLQELVTNQERMTTKLKRYKRRNKNLQQELQSERQDMEEMLISTIQQFYKIMDNHDEERQRWTQGALKLRRELDATKAQLQKERHDTKLQQNKMEQEVESLRQDCNKAQEQVIKATEGLEELKLHYQRKRHSKVQLLLLENSQLVHENHKLKQAMLSREDLERVRLSKALW